MNRVKSVLFASALLIIGVAQTNLFAQAAPHTTTCTPLDTNRTKCVTNFAPAVSGGGKWFGAYWDADSMAPDGSTVESASLDVGGPNAPHRCVVDLNSPIAENDTEADARHVAWVPGNPDTQWMNHKINGVWSTHQAGKGAWSVCYVAQQTDRRVYFRYAIQGIEKHGVFGFEKIPYTPYVFPYYYAVNDQQIAEAAQLVAVYVKPAPPTHAHTVAKGESLTVIAQAAYGKPEWQKILEANKGKIGDANRIYPGTVLTIPAP